MRSSSSLIGLAEMERHLLDAGRDNQGRYPQLAASRAEARSLSITASTPR